MGNVHAAGAGPVPSPPMGAPPPPMPGAQGQSSVPPQAQTPPPPPSPPEETGPGTFEDLHKKCKELFPVPFEGAKVIFNKGLSNHFQISHTLTLSTLQPSGYRFGATYVGTKQFGPAEAYPVMLGDIDPSGNMNANIIHQVTESLKTKFSTQIQGGKWVVSQMTTDFKGSDFVASLTLGNPDIINSSGVMVSHYLQKVTENLSLGAELVYQYGQNIPGRQMSIFTLGGKYTGDKWQLSGNLTPASMGAHLCYYQRVNDQAQIGVEIEGGLRTMECTATLGYQVEIPAANLTFKGQLDSNWCVAAMMEKRLPPLPFTFALSGFANHVKGAYRFGVGLIIG